MYNTITFYSVHFAKHRYIYIIIILYLGPSMREQNSITINSNVKLEEIHLPFFATLIEYVNNNADGVKIRQHCILIHMT